MSRGQLALSWVNQSPCTFFFVVCASFCHREGGFCSWSRGRVSIVLLVFASLPSCECKSSLFLSFFLSLCGGKTFSKSPFSNQGSGISAGTKWISHWVWISSSAGVSGSSKLSHLIAEVCLWLKGKMKNRQLRWKVQIALFYCPGSEVGWYAGHCREAQKFLSYFKDWREHHIFQTVLVKGHVHTAQSQDAALAAQQLLCRGSWGRKPGK